jgi:predicted phage terminase large subunit-like protein
MKYDSGEIAKELLVRRKARDSLVKFTEFTYGRYQAASIHYRIAEALERVERGEIDRLMLLVPPRHGKSELASRRFPAWYLGRHPERQFISASAGRDLAEDFGRDVRNLLQTVEYGALFPTTLAEDSMAKGRWNTVQGGSYYAVGVGSQIMGRGGHVILIDDPFGSMNDARSEAERKNVWSWYQGSVYNRLEEKGAIVVINHRMHEDDLTGKLLAEMQAGGDQWEVVELKPDMDAGIAVWPEKYPLEVLERIKRNTDPRDWSALYLQNPVPEEGNYFKADWLRVCQTLPPLHSMSVYGASDYAVTSQGGYYTVHVVVGIDPENRMYVLDVWRRQCTPEVWIDVYCDLVKKWKPAFWAEETGQISSGLGPFLLSRSRERQAYTGRERFPVRHDKAVRSQSIRGRMALQGLYVRPKESWYSDMMAELLAFPHGKHDDIVDALGLVGQLLDKVHKGTRLQRDVRKEMDRAYRPAEPDLHDSFLTL